MLRTKLTIGSKTISESSPPYIIAEAGSNFNQSMDTARHLIDVAAAAGADAVKFQLFRADELYPDGGEMYDIFKSVELDPDWLPELFRHAEGCDVSFLASAFDRGSVDALEIVGIPAHKIASSETANLPLLHYIASKRKPMIISTGMCDMVDVEEAVAVCLAAGNDTIALLQCGAIYPLAPEHANLQVMNAFRQRFSCPVGFSDHTLGTAVGVAATALGASVIEKHFTLDRKSDGPDHFYALEPDELKSFVTSIHEAHRAMGDGIKAMLPEERNAGRREGLYAAKDIPVGRVMNDSDIVIKRPAVGIRSRYKDIVAGAVALTDIAKDEPLTWDQFSL